MSASSTSSLEESIAKIVRNLEDLSLKIAAAEVLTNQASPEQFASYSQKELALRNEKLALLQEKQLHITALNQAVVDAPSRKEFEELKAVVEQQKAVVEQQKEVVEQQKEIVEQQKEVVEQQKLTIRYAELMSNPRLAIFSNTDGCGSVQVSTSIKASIRQFFNNQCLFCGCSDALKLSVAHIIPEPPAAKLKHRPHLVQAFASFRAPHYKEDFHVKSPRNLILLCGTKGKVGTCHSAFDNHQVGIVHNIFQNTYSLFWFISPQHRVPSGCPDEVPLNNVPVNWDPYRRGLAFHLIKCVTVHYASNSRDEMHRLLDLADYAAVSDHTERNKSGSQSNPLDSFDSHDSDESDPSDLVD
jgi:hypothetical protein